MTRLAAVALLCACATAVADERPRSIAVLEFRNGTAGAHDLGARMAALLHKETSHPIVDPTDARRIGGNKIDDQVARCSGEPHCIAQIGARLGVDEVLLVGVSDLGDVILALQRVDVKQGRVLARVADSMPRDSDANDAMLDGYLKKLYPPDDFLRWGELRIDANLAGAIVEVGGKQAGLTPLAPLRIRAPQQRLEIRVSKKGYQDFVARVDVPPEGGIAVRAVLVAKASAGWYTKPWVWGIVGAVVVGGVTTAIVLSQPAPTTVPVTIHF